MFFPPLPGCTERLHEVDVLRTPFLSAQIQTQHSSTKQRTSVQSQAEPRHTCHSSVCTWGVRRRSHATQLRVTGMKIRVARCGAGQCCQSCRRCYLQYEFSSYQLIFGLGRVREHFCVVTRSSRAVLNFDVCACHLDARVDELLHGIALASTHKHR